MNASEKAISLGFVSKIAAIVNLFQSKFAIGGALVLTLADLLARIGSIEFPVGVVTALCGSPVFIWLLYQLGLQICPLAGTQ